MDENHITTLEKRIADLEGTIINLTRTVTRQCLEHDAWLFALQSSLKDTSSHTEIATSRFDDNVQRKQLFYLNLLYGTFADENPAMAARVMEDPNLRNKLRGAPEDYPLMSDE